MDINQPCVSRSAPIVRTRLPVDAGASPSSDFHPAAERSLPRRLPTGHVPDGLPLAGSTRFYVASSRRDRHPSTHPRQARHHRPFVALKLHIGHHADVPLSEHEFRVHELDGVDGRQRKADAAEVVQDADDDRTDDAEEQLYQVRYHADAIVDDLQLRIELENRRLDDGVFNEDDQFQIYVELRREQVGEVAVRLSCAVVESAGEAGDDSGGADRDRRTFGRQHFDLDGRTRIHLSQLRYQRAEGARSRRRRFQKAAAVRRKERLRDSKREQAAPEENVDRQIRDVIGNPDGNHPRRLLVGRDRRPRKRYGAGRYVTEVRSVIRLEVVGLERRRRGETVVERPSAVEDDVERCRIQLSLTVFVDCLARRVANNAHQVVSKRFADSVDEEVVQPGLAAADLDLEIGELTETGGRRDRHSAGVLVLADGNVDRDGDAAGVHVERAVVLDGGDAHADHERETPVAVDLDADVPHRPRQSVLGVDGEPCLWFVQACYLK